MKGRGSIPTAPAVHTQLLLYGRNGGEAGLKFTSSLKENYAFRRLYAKGKSAASPCLAVYCRKNRTGGNRLGLTVGKKVGKAVVRNKVRRRIREIYRTNEGRIRSGYDIVVVARVRAVFTPYAKLEYSFLKLMDKLGLLRGEEEAS